MVIMADKRRVDTNKKGLLRRFFGAQKSADAPLVEQPTDQAPAQPNPSAGESDQQSDKQRDHQGAKQSNHRGAKPAGTIGAEATLRLPETSDPGTLDFAPGEPVARFSAEAERLDGRTVPDRRATPRSGTSTPRSLGTSLQDHSGQTSGRRAESQKDARPHPPAERDQGTNRPKSGAQEPASKIAARLKKNKKRPPGEGAAGALQSGAERGAEPETAEAAFETSNWRVLFGEEEGSFLPGRAQPSKANGSKDDQKARPVSEDMGPENLGPEDIVSEDMGPKDMGPDHLASGDKDAVAASGRTDETEPQLASKSAEGPDGASTKAAPWFARLRQGLARTSANLANNIGAIFTQRKLNDETLEELEDALIQADLGIDAAMQVTEALAKGRYNKEISDEEVKGVLAAEVAAILAPVAQPLTLAAPNGLEVILMVGVNGSGKTTTIGKLAQKYAQEGRKVMLAAGDTFRAAAIEQLKIWGERTGAPVISRETGADAAGLAFDAMKEAKAAGRDLLLIDTAGRLQNKAELMAELEKIVRVIKKHDPDAPHHVILTLDATTGQNALSQADVFGKSVGVTGVVMTKLDGTARGGILVAMAQRFGLPVHFIGVGETAEDLQPFKARDFARAIVGLSSA